MLVLARDLVAHLETMDRRTILLAFHCVLMAVAGTAGGFGAATARPSGDVEPALVRADFCIVGASCAACLMRVEDVLRRHPGVKKVGVSIHKPYRAVIVFVKDKATVARLEDAVKAKEKSVKFVGVTMEPVEQLPAMLIPKGESPNK